MRRSMIICLVLLLLAGAAMSGGLISRANPKPAGGLTSAVAPIDGGRGRCCAGPVT